MQQWPSQLTRFFSKNKCTEIINSILTLDIMYFNNKPNKPVLLKATRYAENKVLYIFSQYDRSW